MSMSAISYHRSKSQTNKILIILVFILCTIPNLINADPTIATTCSNLNPYYNHLISKGVKFQHYKPVFPATSRCGLEWKMYGTCCDETALIDHARKDGYSLDYASFFLHKLNIFSGHYGLIQIVAPNIKKDPKAHPAFKWIVNALESDPALANFSRSAAHFRSVEFISEFEECRNITLNVRSSALCGTCSGRSKQFFDGKRGIVTESICESVLNVCAKTFEKLLKLIENLGSFFIVLERFTKMVASSTLASQVSKGKIQDIPKVFDEAGKLKQHDLVQIVRSYIHSNGMPSKSVTADMCEKTVALSSTSILLTLPRMIEAVINPMSETLKNYSILIFKYKRFYRRVLTFLPVLPEFSEINQSNWNITGDVKVIHSNIQISITLDPSQSNYRRKSSTEETDRMPFPLFLDPPFP